MAKITIITSLYRSEIYLSSYLSYVSKLVNIDECEILLLNNEPTEKERQIITEYIKEKKNFRYIEIPQRESLYATWNRGCKIANGEYICIWNVDDVRTPDSIYKQAQILDINPKAVYAHGDFTLVSKYGDCKGVIIREPDTETDTRSKNHRHLGGCFPMWRKAAHEVIGYFDEQLNLVADLDFQIRLSLKYKFVNSNTMLGYYLVDSPNRLSKNIKRQACENNMLYLRYSLWSLVDPIYIHDAKKMDLCNIYSFSEKRYLDLSKDIKYQIEDISRLAFLIKCLHYWPYCLLRYFKHNLFLKKNCNEL